MRIYTDASTKKVSGIAYVATNERNKIIKFNSTVTPSTNNNLAELQAILYALLDTKKLEAKTVTIFTDSTYAINKIRCGTYKEDEKLLIASIKQEMEERNCKLFWVKGHCQDGTILSHFNKEADSLSKEARKEYEDRMELQQAMKMKKKRYR
jgi:ribonuclease HI